MTSILMESNILLKEVALKCYANTWILSQLKNESTREKELKKTKLSVLSNMMIMDQQFFITWKNSV